MPGQERAVARALAAMADIPAARVKVKKINWLDTNPNATLSA